MPIFNKYMSWLFAISLLTPLAACTARPGAPGAGTSVSQDSQEILIGHVGSLTGNEASFGISTENGVKLALAEINASGGVRGKKLRLISLDDQGKPEEAAIAVTKLVTQDHVAAVLGEVASSRSIAMAPIAQRYQVPMISPTSTNPRVTQTGNYIFRVCFIDPFQGRVMAKFALEQLKAKRVAVLRDVKNDYSVGLANFFTQTFKAGGGEIVIDESYSAGDSDFKSQLTSIKAQNPDAIFVPGYYGDVALIMKQRVDLGIQAPLLGGDGWDSPKLSEIAGTAMGGNYFSNHYSFESTDPAVVQFVATYRKAYNGVTPDSMAALGYDAAKILANAMTRAKSLSGPDLRDAIAATHDYPAVTGKITLDQDRNAIKSAVVLQTVGSQYKYLTTVSP
jgi:branched-chain amino acid transport system substrate-binding protein